MSVMYLLAMLAATGTGPAAAPTGTVTASVAHSEWTASGEVSLDLRSGRYRLRHQPSRITPRAPVPTTRGRLAASELQPIRSAYAQARAQGLTERVCLEGGRPPQLFLSNGGPQSMSLSGGGARIDAHSERGCWTEAAGNLQRLLEASFGWRARNRN
jgi:hypothetical protein